MFRVASADTVLRDFNIPIADGAGMRRALEPYGVVIGNKTYQPRDVFEEIFKRFFIEDRSGPELKVRGTRALLDLTDNREPIMGPGGSTLNLGVTAVRLSGRQNMAFDLVAVTALDHYGDANRRYIRDAGINLVPSNLPRAIAPQQTTRSLAFMHGLSTTYVVFDGGAKPVVKGDFITPELIERSTMALLPGSARRKFEPQVAGRLFAFARAGGKLLGYVLPSGVASAQKYARFSQKMIRYADVVFGNDGEMYATAYPERDQTKMHPDAAVEGLQRLFQQPLIDQGKFGRSPWKGYQLGLITKGKDGSYFVMPHDVLDRPAALLTQKLSTGGAGDSLAGTGLAFLVADMAPSDVLDGASNGAAAKIEKEWAAIQRDPRQNMSERVPDLTDRFVAGMEAQAVIYSGMRRATPLAARL